MQLGWVVVALFVFCSSAFAQKAAPCASGPACVEKGDALRNGRLIEPDRAAAVAAFEKACQLGEAHGCLEAARLYQRGWMFEVERKRDRARELAAEASKKAPGCGTSEACVVSFDAQLMILEQSPPIDTVKASATQLVNDAQKGCEKTAEACRWIYDNASWLSNHGYLEKSVVDPMRDKAAASVESQCKKTNNPSACYWAGKYAKKDEIAAKYFEPACKASYKNACFLYWEARFDSTKPADVPAMFKEAIGQLEPACEKNPVKECADIGRLYMAGADGGGVQIPKDLAKGVALVEKACKAGDLASCESLGKNYQEGKGVPPNATKAQQLLARGCRLSEPDDPCELCNLYPTSVECKMRATWDLSRSCEVGDENACATVGDTFRGKELRDHPRAARYYRRACDQAVKTACASLDEMCVAGNDVDQALCQQSLIHTDLFYEAEWQFRHTGQATLNAGGEAGEKVADKISGLEEPARAAAAGGGFKRGSLDADLVVGIVLDRARQAAIQIVVDELTHAGRGGQVAGYLHDLLAQAALLLGDKNTLRREKLTDLARTVVRALLASNLVNTLYPDVDDLVGNPLFEQWAGKAQTVKWRPADRERLRRYFTDWTYFLLGETKLFAGATANKIITKLPGCPFSRNPGKQVCEWLVEGDKPNYERLGPLLRINTFVDGLALARVIRAEREVDLRRLVEALGRSKSVANFNATPGLNLTAWERDLVGGVETRLRDLRDEVDAIAKIADASTFNSSNPPPWTDLQTWGRGARRLLMDRGAAALFSREQQNRLDELTRILTRPPPPPGPPRPPGPPGSSATTAPSGPEGDVARAARVSSEIAAKLSTWDGATKSDLVVRINELRRRITGVRPHVAALSRQIDEIRYATKRLSRGQLSIDAIPLSGLPELNESLDGALAELKKLDEELRALFPGTHRTQVRFAISAVVRLRGFLSLMDRISRRAPLNQTVGEIMASVKMLGNVRKGRFTAPLFDVVEPALDAIATHRPLDSDVLFSMIARARLDSLVTSLESTGERRPCEKDEGGTECWTVKVIHALQESVQRDNEVIRVDGGQFAKRLAIHGDDFRRHHKWGSFFHLTVGFGGMYSINPPEVSGGTVVDGKNRTVPVVAEQIGFGLASPTFWGDRLTYKLGLFGSGILYRMVLDSSESNAVSLGGFMAFDINNLIELYVAPAVMLYPPEGDRSITPRLSISAGIQVPLGAYLEKLTD
jgi:uncharacterized protein